MTVNRNKDSGTESHSSWEVSLFEILENLPDDKTVNATHLSLCKSRIPGTKFSDAARNLAFNKVCYAFILSIGEDLQLRVSGGFSTIKMKEEMFATPKTIFASFYPGKF